MAKKYQTAETPEWSASIEVDKITSSPQSFRISADEEERADLARRFGVSSVDLADATVTLRRVQGATIHAIGTLEAQITQACVISLQPVIQKISEEFEGWFGESATAVSFARAKIERDAQKSGGMESEILEESVDPEPIVGGKVDLGELVAQTLSLAIDPYPHAQGAVHTEGVDGIDSPDAAPKRRNPFEALKDWKEKR